MDNLIESELCKYCIIVALNIKFFTVYESVKISRDKWFASEDSNQDVGLAYTVKWVSEYGKHLRECLTDCLDVVKYDDCFAEKTKKLINGYLKMSDEEVKEEIIECTGEDISEDFLPKDKRIYYLICRRFFESLGIKDEYLSDRFKASLDS